MNLSDPLNGTFSIALFALEIFVLLKGQGAEEAEGAGEAKGAEEAGEAEGAGEIRKTRKTREKTYYFLLLTSCYRLSRYRLILGGGTRPGLYKKASIDLRVSRSAGGTVPVSRDSKKAKARRNSVGRASTGAAK